MTIWIHQQKNPNSFEEIKYFSIPKFYITPYIFIMKQLFSDTSGTIKLMVH